ncbi:SDR family oxidoreductase [Algoriphagus machipongonensis]|uniref:Helix-loop-helix' dimerization domain signature protein n=1 Tax=Algoriphagus machipongonensis TaxID=388413 RepID=A3I2L7_9BACT|nr:SDR family oxidoreductase [Algoriphagus machipongonensis]EAZ79321.1 helix-loop-helix' dimerization domain signature protein [Algoriphagus machipongonensis]
MRVLLTGASGYIGKRLLPVLIENGHQVICCVRDTSRFNPEPEFESHIEVIEVDFLEKESLDKIPKDIDGAYYLLHSMAASSDYEELELKCARNFREAINQTDAKHVIYLSGIVNESSLSKHLSSRKAVEVELKEGKYHFTTFRAGIIIGSGSASFEIIRDLVEKLPIMITPKWLNTKCQPIGIADVIAFLQKALLKKEVYDQNFDIGGPDILSYKEMLLGFAEARGLERKIYIVPVMTPRLSSYWLYFVTSTSYKLATALVSSMKVEVICQPSSINEILDVKPSDYKTALKKTLYKIKGNEILSSWKDSWSSGVIDQKIDINLSVPQYGCFKDVRSMEVKDTELTKEKIWQIGGDKGWYYGNWLWKVRGFLDQLVGGVGLRRGRSHPSRLLPGDALDFWRVLYANQKEGRLLLFAEMKLPGEAWLEFNLKDGILKQTATFRPSGISGRLYWYAVFPFHGFIFNGMLNKLAS